MDAFRIAPAIPHFYEQDEDRFLPSHLAASPWERGKQNGVALGGLLAHLIETIPSPAPMTVARLGIDILAAAPHEATVGRIAVLRDGRRIQLVQAELVVDDRVVARATALRTRIAETPAFEEPNPYPAPETVPPSDFMGERAFGGTLETRLVSGGLREPGPGTLWVRFGHEHVAGVPLSPLVRTAILGDFGGGLGSVVPSEDWTYANLDIMLHMTRPAESDWLLIDARTTSAGNGVAFSTTTIADVRGPFAQGHQTLFMAPRGG